MAVSYKEERLTGVTILDTFPSDSSTQKSTQEHLQQLYL